MSFPLPHPSSTCSSSSLPSTIPATKNARHNEFRLCNDRHSSPAPPLHFKSVTSNCPNSPFGKGKQLAPPLTHTYTAAVSVHTANRMPLESHAAARTGCRFTSTARSWKDEVSHIQTVEGWVSARVARRLASADHAKIPTGRKRDSERGS